MGRGGGLGFWGRVFSVQGLGTELGCRVVQDRIWSYAGFRILGFGFRVCGSETEGLRIRLRCCSEVLQ